MRKISEFIVEDNDKLIVLSNNNCFFNNFITTLLIRNLDPTLLLGSLLGLISEKMINPSNFLGEYFNYHFNMTWGINIMEEYMFDIHDTDVEDIHSFKRFLNQNFVLSDSNIIIGMVLNVNDVFFRKDFDYEFWGIDGVSHFFLVSELDFDKDSCVIVDTYDTKEFENSAICIGSKISELLFYMSKDIESTWVMDIDGLILQIKSENKNTEDFIIKNMKSMKYQACCRVSEDRKDYIAPIALIRRKIESSDDLDDIWNNWLNPKLNVLLTITLHRYFVSDFIMNYFPNYFSTDITNVLKLLSELELNMDMAKYASFKHSVTSHVKKQNLIKGEIVQLLEIIDDLEIELSSLLLNNIRKIEMK